MSQEHSAAEDHQERIIKLVSYGEGKGKEYLPEDFSYGGLGIHPGAKAVYTYAADIPMKEGSPFNAILIDQESGERWLRPIRIEAGQIFVISPSWPFGEVSFPLDYFRSIERVHGILF